MEEINLYDLMRYYAKNWYNLLAAIFIGAIIGLAYTYLVQTPLYKSEATMIITGRTSASDTIINNNYAELFKSRLVLDDVIKQKDYSGNYDELLSRTSASTDKNSDVMHVTIADPNPEASQVLLNQALNSFKAKAGDIYANSEKSINVVDSASLPDRPYNVKSTMQVGLAVAAAFFVAIIGLFFVYDYKNSNPKYTKATKKKKKAMVKNNVQASSLTTETVAKKTSKKRRTKKVVKPTDESGK